MACALRRYGVMDSGLHRRPPNVTPAIRFLKQQKIVHTLHTYQIENPTGRYGLDAANALGVSPDRLYKTLLVALNGDQKKLAVCIIPVSKSLNLKLAAKCFGAKKAEMANPDIAERTTGYVVGGISPFGQKKRLPIAVDESAEVFDFIFCSGGKRGLQIELAPQHLISALKASSAQLTEPNH
ncbi:MAG: Cys-tRNA(Pro) deacylase [Reinekea sp.]